MHLSFLSFFATFDAVFERIKHNKWQLIETKLKSWKQKSIHTILLICNNKLDCVLNVNMCVLFCLLCAKKNGKLMNCFSMFFFHFLIFCAYSHTRTFWLKQQQQRHYNIRMVWICCDGHHLDTLLMSCHEQTHAHTSITLPFWHINHSNAFARARVWYMWYFCDFVFFDADHTRSLDDNDYDDDWEWKSTAYCKHTNNTEQRANNDTTQAHISIASCLW